MFDCEQSSHGHTNINYQFEFTPAFEMLKYCSTNAHVQGSAQGSSGGGRTPPPKKKQEHCRFELGTMRVKGNRDSHWSNEDQCLNLWLKNEA